MSVLRFRWHNCRRRHLSGRTFAACAFPDIQAQHGSGQWAVLSQCSAQSIELFLRQDVALRRLEEIDDKGCSPACTTRTHELGFLDLAAAQRDVLRPIPGEVA